MEAAYKIIKDIKAGKIAPIYFLMGEEPYYIDRVSEYIEEHLLPEEDKGFNQTVVYGRDTTPTDLISLGKQFPMMADRQLIVIKEAQALNRNIEEFESYFLNPVPSTVMVFCFKYSILDKRKKSYKALAKHAVILESPKIKDYQIGAWIEKYIKSKNYQIEPKALSLLSEYMGSDLSQIVNNIQKLIISVRDGMPITTKDIEENIGISKDFNVFELRKAIAYNDRIKAYQIIKHFSDHPKENPMVLTTTMVYQYFVQLLQYHGFKDKHEGAKHLGIQPYFIKDYDVAIRNYPMKRVSAIVHSLRQIDVMSKGVGSNISHADLLKEMLFKIFD